MISAQRWARGCGSACSERKGPKRFNYTAGRLDLPRRSAYFSGIETARLSSPSGAFLEHGHADAALSLLFTAGERPAAGDIDRAMATIDPAMRGRIRDLSRQEGGEIVLHARGQIFDLAGLMPAAACAQPSVTVQFGLWFDPALVAFDAVTLRPRMPIAAGAATLSVVRVMAELVAGLGSRLGAKAVCWHPARSCMAIDYFSRATESWLGGGAFPALGFADVRESEAGGFESAGLGFFIGQEIRLEASRHEARGESIKRAVRAIDYLVRHGSLDTRKELESGPRGTVLAEPSADGSWVKVWLER